MRSLLAFTKKEFMEQIRTGRLMITLALFIVLGIMNPAIAKLTPWILDMLSDALAESGMTITTAQVSALDSWMQFYKNLPIGLIAFVLLHGTVFTREYGAGTLVLSLTKGLKRYKVVVAKSLSLTAIWSFSYWLCFAITYLYNSYYWDNSVASSLGLSAVMWWLFGIFVISLTMLISSASLSGTAVLMGAGGAVLALYVVGLLPKIGKYMPTSLMSGTSLVYGVTKPSEYVAAIIITAVLTLSSFAASIPLFNKKQL